MLDTYILAVTLGLIRLNFRPQGITRDADLFSEKCELSDFNSFLSRELQRSSDSINPEPDLFLEKRESSDFNSFYSREP